MRRGVRWLLVAAGLAACSRDPDLTGRWTATDDSGDTATFIFRGDGTALILKGAQAQQFRYEVDGSQEPMWLDLIVSTVDGDTSRMPGIMEVLEEDIIRYRSIVELGEERPRDFAPRENGEQPGMVLRRRTRRSDAEE